MWRALRLLSLPEQRPTQPVTVSESVLSLRINQMTPPREPNTVLNHQFTLLLPTLAARRQGLYPASPELRSCLFYARFPSGYT